MSEDDIEVANARLVPSIGTCGVMGTASTIADDGSVGHGAAGQRHDPGDPC